MKRIFLLISIVILFSCDGPYKNCDEYYFTNEFKSYVFFNNDSYWIYEDSSKNVIDSCIITSASLEFIDYCDYNTESEELLKHKIYSSFFPSPSGSFTYQGSASLREYGAFGPYPMGYYRDNDEILDSVKIRNTWFENVKVHKFDNYEFYWAKNIGLIKKILPYPNSNDSIYSFELIRYEIK